MDEEAIRWLARDIETAGTVVALTGAGISTASGVPSFRGEDGIWAQFDQADFHYDRFQRDPAGFWEDRIELRETMVGNKEITPNAAHDALAELEQRGDLDAVITQNIDGLHAAAGTETVITLHGTNQVCDCPACGLQTPAGPVFEEVRNGGGPPRCGDCGAVLKPGVVLFGESLPEEPLSRAQSLAEESDVFLAIGSSLQVRPAANLPVRARRAGATLAVLNLDPTPVSEDAAYDIRADVTEVLPELVRTIG
jgi:NAD-dependent deacetylase